MLQLAGGANFKDLRGGGTTTGAGAAWLADIFWVTGTTIGGGGGGRLTNDIVLSTIGQKFWIYAEMVRAQDGGGTGGSDVVKNIRCGASGGASVDLWINVVTGNAFLRVTVSDGSQTDSSNFAFPSGVPEHVLIEVEMTDDSPTAIKAECFIWNTGTEAWDSKVSVTHTDASTLGAQTYNVSNFSPEMTLAKGDTRSANGNTGEIRIWDQQLDGTGFFYDKDHFTITTNSGTKIGTVGVVGTVLLPTGDGAFDEYTGTGDATNAYANVDTALGSQTAVSDSDYNDATGTGAVKRQTHTFNDIGALGQIYAVIVNDTENNGVAAGVARMVAYDGTYYRGFGLNDTSTANKTITMPSTPRYLRRTKNRFNECEFGYDRNANSGTHTVYSLAVGILYNPDITEPARGNLLGDRYFLRGVESGVERGVH